MTRGEIRFLLQRFPKNARAEASSVSFQYTKCLEELDEFDDAVLTNEDGWRRAEEAIDAWIALRGLLGKLDCNGVTSVETKNAESFGDAFNRCESARFDFEKESNKFGSTIPEPFQAMRLMDAVEQCLLMMCDEDVETAFDVVMSKGRARGDW